MDDDEAHIKIEHPRRAWVAINKFGDKAVALDERRAVGFRGSGDSWEVVEYVRADLTDNGPDWQRVAARAVAEKIVLEQQLAGAVDAERERIARHLTAMATDEVWKPEARAALAYAARTLPDANDRTRVMRPWYVCEGVLGEMSDFQGECKPNMTHGRLIRVASGSPVRIAFKQRGAVKALERARDVIGRVQDGTMHPGRNLAREYVKAGEALNAARGMKPGDQFLGDRDNESDDFTSGVIYPDLGETRS